MSRSRANIRGGGGGERRKLKIREERTTKEMKVQKMYKKSYIISVKKVLILTAGFFPKLWVETSDRTSENSLKLVHWLLRSGHDRKKKSELK